MARSRSPTRGASEAATKTQSDRLYLDDLHVGQRFAGKTHALDEAQIKGFAIQFDPQPFTLTSKPRNARSSMAWRRAVGTPPRSRCV
jgi:hypothetical protein